MHKLHLNGQYQCPLTELKPWSHIACDRSVTSLRPQGGCRAVARNLQKVAGTLWLQGGFGCCKWNLCDQIDRRKVFGGRRQVADWSLIEWLLIADQLQRLQTIPTPFSVADWSPTSHRSVAIINKRSRYSRQPVAVRSPIRCRSLPNWSPTARRRVGTHCPITRQ